MINFKVYDNIGCDNYPCGVSIIIAQDLSFLPVLLSLANIAEVFSGQLLPSAAIVFIDWRTNFPKMQINFTSLILDAFIFTGSVSF